MIRKLKLTIAAIALIAGFGIGTAQPAAAHHTHSAWTLCSEQKNRYYPGSSYTLVAAQSYYNNTNGHAVVAACTIRRNWNYTNFVRCYWYSTHGNYTGGVGICP